MCHSILHLFRQAAHLLLGPETPGSIFNLLSVYSFKQAETGGTFAVGLIAIAGWREKGLRMNYHKECEQYSSVKDRVSGSHTW